MLYNQVKKGRGILMIFKRMNEIEGDFILKVKVSHDFKETYDSASVMVMVDDTHWAKCCYELTDFGTHAAVSVVTKGDSNDANGCNLEGNSA